MKNPFRLSDLTIASRIYRLSATVVLIFLLVIGYLFLHLRESLYETRRQELYTRVDACWQVLDFHSRAVSAGSLSSEAARRQAIQILADQRFAGEGYCWISDEAMTMVMHPSRKAEELWDLSHYRDPDGRLIFVEMTDLANRDGEGFIEYLWPRLGQTKPLSKVAYVKKFPAWSWTVGSGYYVDDVDRHVLRLFFVGSSLLLLVILSAIVLVAFVARSISIPTSKAVSMIEALEKGDLGHRLKLTHKDEIGRLARSMDAFADNLQYEVLTAFERLARGDFSFEAKGLIREPLQRTNVRLNALVAAQQEAVAREQLERAKLKALIDAMGDGVAFFDRNLIFTYQNPSHIAFAGTHLGGKCNNADQRCDVQCVDCPVTLALEDGKTHRKTRHITNDGRDLYIETAVSAVHDEAGNVASLVEVARDVTERKLNEERIRQLALHDSLTGAANRILLEDRMRLALAQANRTGEIGALYFIDMDRFKAINDTYGHYVGDQLLVEVVQRLKSLVRATDTICRSGGDEFILLVPQLHEPSDASIMAAKILYVFSHPFIIDDREITVSASIGISLYPADGKDLLTLCKKADSSMYIAKGNGRNNYQFYRSG
jgi:diguanylate cyclase (GGDEF)-like protein